VHPLSSLLLDVFPAPPEPATAKKQPVKDAVLAVLLPFGGSIEDPMTSLPFGPAQKRKRARQPPSVRPRYFWRTRLCSACPCFSFFLKLQDKSGALPASFDFRLPDRLTRLDPLCLRFFSNRSHGVFGLLGLFLLVTSPPSHHEMIIYPGCLLAFAETCDARKPFEFFIDLSYLFSFPLTVFLFFLLHDG